MKAAVIYSATFEKLRVEQRYKGAPFKLSNACTPLRETSKFRLIIFALRSFVFFFFFLLSIVKALLASISRLNLGYFEGILFKHGKVFKFVRSLELAVLLFIEKYFF